MMHTFRLIALAAFTAWLGATAPAHAGDDPPAAEEGAAEAASEAAPEADASAKCAKCAKGAKCAECAEGGKCSMGKGKMAAIKAELAAMDERAAELMAAVHAAPKPKRMDAMVALLDELVAQRHQGRAKMAEMHRLKMEHMGAHHGGKKGCKKTGKGEAGGTEDPAEHDHAGHHPSGEEGED